MLIHVQLSDDIKFQFHIDLTKDYLTHYIRVIQSPTLSITPSLYKQHDMF